MLLLITLAAVGSFVLVLVAGGKALHYPIDRANGSLCIVYPGKQRFFPSLRDLLDYYTRHHDLPVKLATRVT